ncbi:MAG: hypothetical protein KF681_08650 [Bdellovibrionaceae bacterium]|nr:hypothetical protein [Pseudobdellovibrionaceae bacterium]
MRRGLPPGDSDDVFIVVNPRFDSSAPLALHRHVREYAHALTALCLPGTRLEVQEYVDLVVPADFFDGHVGKQDKAV